MRSVFVSILYVILTFTLSTANAQEPPRLENAVSAIETGAYPGVTSMIVSVDGTRVATAYGPDVNADEPRDIRSATKSITALLLSALAQEGALPSLETRVAEIVPEPFAAMSADDPRLQIRLEDLLTMRTGLACDDWVPASVGHEDKMYETDDWIAFLLSQPLAHEIGEHFSYCTGGVILLGTVIERLTGEPIPTFARRHLFEPLGIESARWADTPEGGTDTGGHLEITPNDLQVIGEFVLNRGQSPIGEQIASEDWLAEMLSAQTEVYERRQRYGYLWWLDRIEAGHTEYEVAFAWGNGGNFVFVIPELQAVVSFTGVNYGNRLQFQPFAILSEFILPALAAHSE
jgi:CubicO group peptidase (beta-lactamase class C family)